MAKGPKPAHVIHVGFIGRWLRVVALFLVFWLFVIVSAFVLTYLAQQGWNNLAPNLRVQLFPGGTGLWHVVTAIEARLIWIVLPTIILASVSPLILFIEPVRRRLIHNVSQVMAQQGALNLILYLVSMPLRLRAPLNRHARNESDLREAPYILIRGACHSAQVYLLPIASRREWFRDPLLRRQGARFKMGNHSLLDSLNDILVAQIARALDADIKPQFGEGTWFDDVITDIRSQKTVLDDGGDLPLRYSQATPQSRFIDHSISETDPNRIIRTQPLDGERPKAKYVVICCLSNPIDDPVYVLPVTAVVRRMAQKYGTNAGRYLATLLKSVTPVFWRIKPAERDAEISDDVLSLYHKDDRQILSRFGDAYRAGFDANKIDYSSMKDRMDARKAIAAFSQALDDATEDEIKIKLKAGDILIINNYYGLHRRIELGYKTLRRPLLFAKRRRWLRVYYAFSRPEIS